jgi:hypothetical protein
VAPGPGRVPGSEARAPVRAAAPVAARCTRARTS